MQTKTTNDFCIISSEYAYDNKDYLEEYDRNKTITVELDSEASESKTVTVTDAAGRTVYRTAVPAGQKSVQMNASRLSSGLNVISVKGDKSKAAGYKVFVK